ncbi:MAG: SAM-dependent methyltransferase, partial [Psychromonas sp.]
ITSHKAQESSAGPLLHDREKKRFVDINRPFLTQLGVTDKQHNLIPAMSRKWKQINKFIEVFSQALAVSPLGKDQPVNVVDFGSGKGYLTFAIHDYLRHSLHNNAQVTGVELRQGLADLCNETAATLDHHGLSFVCGDVKTHAPKQTDVMIALHACDVATDYAIHYGIRANAAIIMCSPCCHKQIRPQMHSPELFKPMLQYGVHMGQQAEMVTDSLRALFLEANGYTTKVFEFISLEHTNKNKMILAVKKGKSNAKENREILDQIAEIKAFYGIKEHCLETLLDESKVN